MGVAWHTERHQVTRRWAEASIHNDNTAADIKQPGDARSARNRLLNSYKNVGLNAGFEYLNILTQRYSVIVGKWSFSWTLKGRLIWFFSFKSVNYINLSWNKWSNLLLSFIYFLVTVQSSQPISHLRRFVMNTCEGNEQRWARSTGCDVICLNSTRFGGSRKCLKPSKMRPLVAGAWARLPRMTSP